MKITPKITELLFDLSEIEGHANSCYLDGDIANLRNNLLQLYVVTKSDQSRETIISIMEEAGYPWFGDLAQSKLASLREIPLKQVANEAQFLEYEERFMSDEDFLDLLPINGYFH